MTKAEASKLPHGHYRLWWKSGGFSLAVVGSLFDGKRWFACANWTAEEVSGVGSTAWRHVKKAESLRIVE